MMAGVWAKTQSYLNMEYKYIQILLLKAMEPSNASYIVVVNKKKTTKRCSNSQRATFHHIPFLT